MRKDLIIRYSNSAITNLHKVQMHLMNQDSSETLCSTGKLNNRIEKEFQTASLTQVEKDFIESQLSNIELLVKTVRTLLEES